MGRWDGHSICDSDTLGHNDQFLPGQWLDVFVPGISKPGGFTITSAPSKAQTGPVSPASAAAPTPPNLPEEPYLELAVQKSPDNPPAHYLWRPAGDILDSELRVRVGGSFVWPPPGIQPMVSSPCPLPRLTYPSSPCRESSLCTHTTLHSTVTFKHANVRLTIQDTPQDCLRRWRRRN